jgi:hypothetical protein
LQSKENAVAEIKRLYNIRWGYRILTAQKALHKLVINPVINDDTVSDFL